MDKNFPPFPFAVTNIIPIFAVLNIHNSQMQDARLAFHRAGIFYVRIPYNHIDMASVYPRVEHQCAHSI